MFLGRTFPTIVGCDVAELVTINDTRGIKVNCNNCGIELVEGARFCDNCGTQVAVIGSDLDNKSKGNTHADPSKLEDQNPINSSVDERGGNDQAITKGLVVGRVYEGEITWVEEFYAFVSIQGPDKEVVLHISQMSNDSIEKITDNLAVGDRVPLEVLGIDDHGGFRLCMKTVESGSEDKDNESKNDELNLIGDTITNEDDSGFKNESDAVGGMRFDRGYLSPLFITEQHAISVNLEDPYILLHDDKISNISELLPILEAVAKASRPLLIIAEDIEVDVLNVLLVNSIRGIVKVCAVKAPGFGDRMKSILADIAVLTGGAVISKEVNLSLEKATLEFLGRAKKINITKESTTITDGAGRAFDIDARVEQIRSRIAESSSDSDKEEMQGRIDKLVGAVKGGRDMDLEGYDLLDMPRALQDSLLLPALNELAHFQRKSGSLASLSSDLKRLGNSGSKGILEKLSFVSEVLEKAVSESLLDPEKKKQIEHQRQSISKLSSKSNELAESKRKVGRLDSASLKNMLSSVLGNAAIGIIPVLIVGIVVDIFIGEVASNIVLGVYLIAVMAPLFFYIKNKFEGFSLGQNVSQANSDVESANSALAKQILLVVKEIEQSNLAAMQKIEEDKEKFKKKMDGYFENLKAQLDQKKKDAGILVADWRSGLWSDWQPYKQAKGAVSLGTLKARGFEDEFNSISTAGNVTVEIPAVVKFPTGSPLFVVADGEMRSRAISVIQSVLAKLLATTPPGKLIFTFVDPIGFGQNVSGFIPLGDYSESLITSRAWSEPEHIDKRLKELTEHMENVIQKYLRHEFRTIEDYNQHAAEVAEPYRVLVVFDFPINFSETAAKRLVSLVQNGPRCGIYPIILCNQDEKWPPFIQAQEFQSNMWNMIIRGEGGEQSALFERVVRSENYSDLTDRFDLKPLPQVPHELLGHIIKEVGEAAKTNMHVVVPYAKVLSMAGLNADHSAGWWKIGGVADGREESTADCVEIPLGPMGARKAQLLTLGKGTAHHALIAGRTGSGKSNLLHVIITTLALKYSPREVELYLIDFKKGVEFKSYANHSLPHARVIAIESEREFGLSVLQGLNDEMQRRGEVFRSEAANNLAEYREKSNTQLPRLILIVDEFQEFFSNDDAIANQAAGILDRLVRQGRSFGIHLLLGSQSLAGSYTLARSTLDQMQIRIALPCSEADSRLILADDNPAARMLSRPGEAIYNASSGLIEGNHVFQVALFSDEDRDHFLQAIAKKGREERRRPIVFEGHEPADIELCGPLVELLDAPEWPSRGKSAEVWLGEPVAMKAPTSVRFRRQGGANLLVVSREEEEGVGILMASVLGLAAQHRPDTAKIYIVDLTTADAGWADVPEDLADLLPHSIEVLGRRDIPGLLEELSGEAHNRIEGGQNDESWIYLVVLGLHRARDLRSDPNKGYSFGEEDAKASLSEQFAMILRDGPEVGIHTLVWCDTYLNLDRTLEPRSLVEFGYRVAGTMTQDDSMRLLDDAAAARLDRPHRMVKYDEERVGVLEKFRPYNIPTTSWLENAANSLRQRT